MDNFKDLPGKAPLVAALLRHRDAGPAPFHMPGGKGRPLAMENLGSMSAFDVTELPDTGNLYEGGDVIEEAERLWAKIFDFPTCQFLTGGSTQGLQAAMLLAAQGGREVLADRCSHRSIYNALALFDLQPTFLIRSQDRPITVQALEDTLLQREKAGKPANTVCITSPTYYGVLSDIPALSRVAHAHGAKLVVDGAHGAHLPFLGQNPFQGADFLVCSAHKTLPTYGQAALLFAADPDPKAVGAAAKPCGPKALRRAASVVGTSSPSYPIMASMDYARAWLESGEGRLALLCVKTSVGRLKSRFGGLENVPLDPLRLTLEVPDKRGFLLKKQLEAEGIFPEMADGDHVVFLFSTANTQEDFRRLTAALDRYYTPLDPHLTVSPPSEHRPITVKAPSEHRPSTVPTPPTLPLPPLPEQVVSPAAALLAPRETRVLSACENRISAQQIAPYPPGIPVISTGERISKKCLAYLEEVGYNVHQEVDVLLPE